MTPDNALVKALIDSNQVVSALISIRGAPYAVLRAFREGRFSLFIAEEELLELEDVIQRPRLARSFRVPDDEITAIRQALRHDSIRVQPLPTLPIAIRDPKDEHIVGAALAGDVDYIVTGDHDLLVLNGDPGLDRLQIVTPSAFLAILDAAS